LETAVTYLRNTYNIFSRLFKTLQYYRVKHKQFQNIAIALPLFDKKAVNSTILYLLIYCLVQQNVYRSRVHDAEELLDIWHGLQHSAVDSAIDRERFFSPAYGPKEDILSSYNMLIE